MEAGDQALAETSDPSGSGINCGTAATSTASNSPQSNNPAVAVAEPLDLPSEVLPALIDSRAVLRGSVRTAKDSPFQGRSHRHDLSIRGEASPESLGVTSVERFYCRPHDLHVLLRHRLLREPHGFEGLSVVPEELHAEHLSLPERVDAGQLHARLRAVAHATPDEPHDNSVGGVEEVGDRFQGVGVKGLALLLPLAHDSLP